MQRWEDFVRLVLLSDTHGKEDSVKVPDGDVLIHAGDFSRGRGTDWHDLAYLSDWMKRLPHARKFLSPGNHDKFVEVHEHEARQRLDPSITLVVDEAFEVEGIKFYASPYTPEFGHDWAYQLTPEEDNAFWQTIPFDTQVLVTHGPPFGILDQTMYKVKPTEQPTHAGSKGLLTAVLERRSIKHHIFGHIHEGHGIRSFGGKQFYNVATCTEYYLPWNPVVVLDL